MRATAVFLTLSAAAGAWGTQVESLVHRVVDGPLMPGPRHFVARSSDELLQYLQTLKSPDQTWDAFVQTSPGRELRDLPTSIDFNARMVLGAVIRGSHSACTGMTITRVKVTPTSTSIQVEVREDQPSAGTSCPASIGAAYHLVSVPRSGMAVVFVETRGSR